MGGVDTDGSPQVPRGDRVHRDTSLLSSHYLTNYCEGREGGPCVESHSLHTIPNSTNWY